MNNASKQNEPYAAYVAIDWADQKHAFSLQVAGHSAKETGTLEQRPEVIGPWVAKLRGLGAVSRRVDPRADEL